MESLEIKRINFRNKTLQLIFKTIIETMTFWLFL